MHVKNIQIVRSQSLERRFDRVQQVFAGVAAAVDVDTARADTGRGSELGGEDQVVAEAFLVALLEHLAEPGFRVSVLVVDSCIDKVSALIDVGVKD